MEACNRPEVLESDHRHPYISYGNSGVYSLMRPGVGAVSIDLSDAYFHIQIIQKLSSCHFVTEEPFGSSELCPLASPQPHGFAPGSWRR